MLRPALVIVFAIACGSPRPQNVADAWIPLDAPTTLGAGKGGGTLDELRFAVVGDTRPANIDDTANYPTDVVRQIWSAVEAQSPHPPFAVTTGDYMNASIDGHQQDPQIDLYLGARAAYLGMVYSALGNHECNSLTESNCGPGGAQGSTPNYVSFLNRMIEPIGEQQAYYVERFAATDRGWTAKFAFVAANAWDDAQAAWLDNVLSEPTTYTFVIRHEPHDATAAPGVTPSVQIMARHAVTMQITGHVHTYQHLPAYQEIIVGNGGAPLTSGANYGYVVISRSSDGTLTISAYDSVTHTVVDQFMVTASGAAP